MPKLSNKDLSVEGVRGVACLMVVFSHLVLNNIPALHNFGQKTTPLDINSISSLLFHSPFAFVYSGSMAIYVFFVLSGYILTKVYFNRDFSLNYFISLSFSRYVRLAFPVLISSVIYLIVMKSGLFSLDSSDWISRLNVPHLTWFDLIEDSLISAFFSHGSQVNWVLWTMKVELFGSLMIFVLIFVKSKSKATSYFLALIILCLCLGLYFFGFISTSFSLGIIAFILGYALHFFSAELISDYIYIPVFFISLYLGGAHLGSNSYEFIESYLGDFLYVACNFMAGFLFVFSVVKSNILSRFFSLKAFVFLGKISFSIYLLHLIVIYMFASYFEGVHIVYFFFCLFFLSLLFYYFVDKKSMELSRFVFQKTPLLFTIK